MADKVYYDESCYVCSLEINAVRSRGEACGIEFIDISADDFDGNVKDFEKESLMVYPNPFTNQTTVSFYNPTQSKADIKVIDSRGRVVREYNNILSNKITIKKDELSEGLYYILLNLNDDMIKKSVVIK